MPNWIQPSWAGGWWCLCKYPCSAPRDAFSEFRRVGTCQVEECHLVAGNFDYLIKPVRDMAYREFLGDG